MFLLQVLLKSEPRFYTQAKVTIQRSVSKIYNSLDEIGRSCITFDCGSLDKIAPLAWRLRVPQKQNKVLQIYLPSFAHFHTKHEYYSPLISPTYSAKLQPSIKASTAVQLCSKPTMNEMESIHGKSQKISFIPRILCPDPLI